MYVMYMSCMYVMYVMYVMYIQYVHIHILTCSFLEGTCNTERRTTSKDVFGIHCGFSSMARMG